MFVCTFGGCKKPAIKDSRCAKHQRATAPRKEYKHHSIGRMANIYNSTRWRALRDKKIRAKPICELCESIGKLTPADVVDHWIEIKLAHHLGHSSLIWDYENLVSLCHRCHNQKTAAFARYYRTDKKKLVWFISENKPTDISIKHLEYLADL